MAGHSVVRSPEALELYLAGGLEMAGCSVMTLQNRVHAHCSGTLGHRTRIILRR